MPLTPSPGIRRLALLIVAATLMAGPTAAAEPAAPGAAAPAVAFLVRHAEKDLADGDDPALTAAGERRAALLAELLAGEGIASVRTTDTLRTRSTAAPLAARLGLEPLLYDGRRLAELAAELRARGERVLVVGHSNTTHELAALLGGAAGPPIADDEYDRLYRIDLVTGATVVEVFGEHTAAPATASRP